MTRKFISWILHTNPEARVILALQTFNSVSAMNYGF